MPERDDFEMHFAAAYRRYLDAAPTEVDAMAVARAVAAHRVGRLGTWPWTLRPSRTLVWIALLTLLLAALWGAALFAGSQRLAPAGFTCPPGSHPDSPGPVNQPRPPYSYSPHLAFDRQHGRIVALTEDETWTFDVCTNTWSQMRPQGQPGPGVFALVYDADSDVTLALADPGYGQGVLTVWAYDLEADAWTQKGSSPFVIEAFPSGEFFPRTPRAVYDASSGLVLVQVSASGMRSDPTELWTYDVETDTWARVDQVNAPDGETSGMSLLAYDTAVDRLVSYGADGKGTVTLDIDTGAWSWGSTGPALFRGWRVPTGGEIAYDEAAGRTVVYDAVDGQLIAYDAAADRWDTLSMNDTGRSGQHMVYDSVNERLVVYGGSYQTPDLGSVWTDDVLAFDTSTLEWSVLLAASTHVHPG